MATDEPNNPSKRPRLDQAGAAGAHAAAAANGGHAAAAPAEAVPAQAANGGQPQQLLTVPPVGDHISTSSLVPALQQLLAAYQVEYWATLEQLRAAHNAAAAAGGQQADGGHGRAGESSLRQLWEASHSSGDAQQQQLPNEATNGTAPLDHHQQQEEEGLLYGDARCGFAGNNSSSIPGPARQLPLQQEQQQQPAALQLPSLHAAEQLLLQLPSGGLDAGAAGGEQRQAWQQRFRAAAAAFAGLEQLASAATMQCLDAQGALACLCGEHGRWVVRRSAVNIGRSTDSKGEVDVDLSAAVTAAEAAAVEAAAAAGPAAEGAAEATAAPAAGGAAAPATPTPAAAAPAREAAGAGVRQVSRLQAQLLLTAAGSWSICNTGRAPMAVNGEQLARGSTVELPHLSLIEIAGLPLLFMVNSMGVSRALSRSAHVTM